MRIYLRAYFGNSERLIYNGNVVSGIMWVLQNVEDDTDTEYIGFGVVAGLIKNLRSHVTWTSTLHVEGSILL